MKRRSLPLRKTPIRKRRSEPRPGRKTGKDRDDLRLQCFERDGYKCQHMVVVAVDWKLGKLYKKCEASVTWESGHMAHIRNKRMWGDDISNVITKCARCHIGIEHSYGPSGVKPCPPKPRN